MEKKSQESFVRKPTASRQTAKKARTNALFWSSAEKPKKEILWTSLLNSEWLRAPSDSVGRKNIQTWLVRGSFVQKQKFQDGK